MYIWHKETTPGTTGARCTIRDGSGLFVAECIASDAAAIVEAPAMLAALRASVACLRGFHASPDFGPLDDEAIDAANTILARIDGTPTDEADDFGAGAAANLSRGALIEAAGEALALSTPIAQPDLAAALADLFERGSWHDDGSFVYWPDDSEPDNEGAIFTLSHLHNRHTA